MTSVERAKRFLQSGARAIALTVVPLASVAVIAPSLEASPLILTPATCDAIPSGSGTFVITPCTTTQLATGADGVTGLKLYGSDSTTSLSAGFLALNFTTQGTASGTAGIVPVAYDFTLSDTFSNAMSWDVYFDVAGNLTDASGTASGISTGGTITGSFSVDLSSIGNAYEYVLHVEAIEEASAPNDTLTIDIPQNSVDVNPVSSAVPEPAYPGLIGSALAALVWWRRRTGK
jgi:hypothetical protein